MSLFDSTTILPDQYFAGDSGDNVTYGERRLMLAVLCDAVECYQEQALARDPVGRTAFAEAAEWIESDDREWPFAYENICDVLGLDPEYLRGGLSMWRRQRPRSARRSARIVPLDERRLVEREPLTRPQSSS